MMAGEPWANGGLQVCGSLTQQNIAPPGALAGTAEASKKPVTQIPQATNAPGIVRGLAQGPAQGLLWVACEVGDAGVKPGRAREKKGGVEGFWALSGS